MRYSFILLALALALTAGCAGSKPYIAPSEKLNAPRARLLDVVQSNARRAGLKIVRVDPGTGVVEAVSSVSSDVGVPHRDRWTFTVRRGTVRAQRLFEARFDRGGWISSDRVCDDYDYSKERAQLHGIAARASVPTRVASRRAAERQATTLVDDIKGR